MLMPVLLNEQGIRDMFLEVSEIVRANCAGPKLYIQFYDQYLWLLDGTAEDELSKFFEKEPNFKVKKRIHEKNTLKFYFFN